MTLADSKLPEEDIEYIVSFDSEGNKLDGGKNYQFRLPPNVPAKSFWSVIVYDTQSRLMVHTEQKWPSVFSNCQTLVLNHDNSIDIWFGPKTPVGKKCNWIQTNPGKGWNMILRLYGPMETWFNKSWRPGEIVEVNLIFDEINNK